MISCLTVTRENKLPELARALECFHRQTLPDKELIIVHDGSTAFNDAIVNAVRQYPGDTMRVHRVPDENLNLGTLRNISLSLARGKMVCQWDDDDLYHPRRLEIQLAELRDTEADFCFLVDQLHYFEPTGEMFWDDWSVEGYPGKLIQGTILGRADLLGRYPDLPRGEDTGIVSDLVTSGCHLHGIAGRGYLYIYVFNGNNTWGLRHHAAISAWKRMPGRRLLEREAELRQYLLDYALPWDTVFLPHESGSIVIKGA